MGQGHGFPGGNSGRFRGLTWREFSVTMEAENSIESIDDSGRDRKAPKGTRRHSQAKGPEADETLESRLAAPKKQFLPRRKNLSGQGQRRGLFFAPLFFV